MAFGVVVGTRENPRIGWIEKPVPVTEELLALTGPVPPTQVFRFSAPCQENGCCHFDGKDCRLATRLVQLLPAAGTSLPACRVRPDCRWFRQEGSAACHRCPEIVTYSVDPTEQLSRAATPDGRAAGKP
ncbi:MAG: hypothetical protein JO062_25755 [Bryobacterales bacterium]|nr:hypothetical protein [Bryobacterales bacterium]